MKRYLLDTNAFLRYILNDIPTQADEITDVFQRCEKKEAIVTIPMVVFLEATYVLTSVYRHARPVVKHQCEAFFAISSLDIPDRYVLREAYMMWVEHSNISFADAVLFHTARLGGKELLTFDKKLQRLARDKNTP